MYSDQLSKSVNDYDEIMGSTRKIYISEGKDQK